MTTENDDAGAQMQWLSEQEVRTALLAGGEQGDKLKAAAAHLLTSTDLASREAGRAHLRLYYGERLDQRAGEREPVLCAEVRDYPALLADRAALVRGTEVRLATLAASFATGQPVDLQEAIGVHGWEPARRVAEAVLIATGAAEEHWYTVEDGPGLPDPQAARAALHGGR